MRSLITLLFLTVLSFAQAQSVAGSDDRPKLVVGIVVDQMRQEYLYRFQAKYGNGGFKRLLNDGFMLKNGHYNYAPTYTGPGHASVYTGTTPAIHGIIGNDFFDKESGKMVNCVGDPAHKPVGSATGNGDVSPWRMLASTITDELKLFTQKRSKVISISVKDRGAVLPAGRMGDAAYWYDVTTGKFITSTYYMNQLPEWVTKFNNQNLPDKYLSQTWNTLLPIEQYTESGPDDSPYERRFKGQEKSVFPYNLKELRAKNNDFELLLYTPFANDYVTEMTKVALINEKLGKNKVTDFLCVSYSTPDIAGHRTGPNAVEVEDMYIRLDRNLADLLSTLDKEVGAGQYIVFLTADHGVADVPQYMVDNKLAAGYFRSNYVEAKLKELLAEYYPGKDIIANISNDQVFLNPDAFQGSLRTAGVEMMIVSELIGKFFMTQKGAYNFYTESVLRQGRFDEGGIKGMMIRGYHPKRSGDVILVLEPGWFESGWVQGTTHGSPYTYDTHVPILFYGKGIRKGSSVRYHTITDIAPTLSMLLNIKLPNGATGQPVEELFE